MGKSDRAVCSARSGFGSAVAPMPAWIEWAVPILAALARHHRGQPGPRGHRRSRMRRVAALPTTAGNRPRRVQAARRREDLPDPRRRRAVLPPLAGRAAARRAAPSCSSIAATSIPAAWRTSPTSSTCRTSPSSPGMRAATAARPASAAFARVLARRCATCRRSSIISRRPTALRPRTSRWSRRASARCWSRPGRTTTRRTSAAWCSPRRPSRSSSTCRSRAAA